MTKQSECNKCGHYHTFAEFCGVVLSADEEAGIILAECTCMENDNV